MDRGLERGVQAAGFFRGSMGVAVMIPHGRSGRRPAVVLTRRRGIRNFHHIRTGSVFHMRHSALRMGAAACMGAIGPQQQRG